VAVYLAKQGRSTILVSDASFSESVVDYLCRKKRELLKEKRGRNTHPSFSRISKEGLDKAASRYANARITRNVASLNVNPITPRPGMVKCISKKRKSDTEFTVEQSERRHPPIGKQAGSCKDGKEKEGSCEAGKEEVGRSCKSGDRKWGNRFEPGKEEVSRRFAGSQKGGDRFESGKQKGDRSSKSGKQEVVNTRSQLGKRDLDSRSKSGKQEVVNTRSKSGKQEVVNTRSQSGKQEVVNTPSKSEYEIKESFIRLEKQVDSPQSEKQVGSFQPENQKPGIFLPLIREGECMSGPSHPEIQDEECMSLMSCPSRSRETFQVDESETIQTIYSPCSAHDSDVVRVLQSDTPQPILRGCAFVAKPGRRKSAVRTERRLK